LKLLLLSVCLPRQAVAPCMRWSRAHSGQNSGQTAAPPVPHERDPHLPRLRCGREKTCVQTTQREGRRALQKGLTIGRKAVSSAAVHALPGVPGKKHTIPVAIII
jgi:hypothetical protein